MNGDRSTGFFGRVTGRSAGHPHEPADARAQRDAHESRDARTQRDAHEPADARGQHDPNEARADAAFERTDAGDHPPLRAPVDDTDPADRGTGRHRRGTRSATDRDHATADAGGPGNPRSASDSHSAGSAGDPRNARTTRTPHSAGDPRSADSAGTPRGADSDNRTRDHGASHSGAQPKNGPYQGDPGDGLAEFAAELKLLAEAVLERVEPVLRRAADGQVEWSSCDWCPVCAAAALVRGEHHEVLQSVADHGTAIVTVLREALAGVPVDPVMPEHDHAAPHRDSTAAHRDAAAGRTEDRAGQRPSRSRYVAIPVTIKA
ncbi:hypothetical protein [Nocardia brasiliensis]